MRTFLVRGPNRCEDGRLMRHDPQPDDPYLETDMGRCPECDGRGCDAAPDEDYDDPDDWTDEDEAALERYEKNRRARIEWDHYHPGEPCWRMSRWALVKMAARCIIAACRR